MRRIFKLSGLLLAGILLISPNPYGPSPAAQELRMEAVVRQGPVARLRARMDRLHRLVRERAAMEAVELGENLLAELKEQKLREAVGDPGLGEEVLLVLAREAIEQRNEALLQLKALPEGKKGAFLRMLLTQAVLSDWQLHVPASVSMAQAILESNWGKSAPGFNLFGIKGTGPEGSTLRKVVEYRKGKRYIRVDRFRAYANTDGSMQDHAELLAKGRAYGRARAVSENPEAYTRALQGSYASDPRYAGKLQRLMELYALHRFDWVDRTPLK